MMNFSADRQKKKVLMKGEKNLLLYRKTKLALK
jgi:hypothetical protein